MTAKATATQNKTYDEATHQWIETPPAPAQAAAPAPNPAPAQAKTKE